MLISILGTYECARHSDAVWSLWQDLIGESQLETLDFWSKAISFLANNYLSFEKQFLACPLALSEAKHLTIDMR